MIQKNWAIKQFDKAEVVRLAKETGISPHIAIILYNRGIRDVESIKKFLACDLGDLHDPYLLMDMDKAVERINRAKENGEKITIYGDYDVDGITSIAILYKQLQRMGIEVGYYVPDRNTEGYGVNREALDNIKADGTTILITVDTGITAVEETVYARSIGMDIIITDHHECKETIPDAYAAIDPKRKECKYPFKHLAGVGVTFKLIQALEPETPVAELMDRYADLLCLGTVADISPLVDENRIMVKVGLDKIANTENVGLKALLDVAITNGKPVSTSTIGYVIAPRINASGRLGCASRSVDMFLTDDKNKAVELAEELCRENIIRQQTEQQMFKEALEYLEAHPEIKDDEVIVIPHENWHHGIVGIVSSKITEKFYKPSILFAVDGEVAKGSGRSINGYNLFEALEYSSDLLDKFGGHELAAGLTMQTANIEEFRKKINSYKAETEAEEEKVPTINIDAFIKPAFISIETVEDINSLNPYGVDNPPPVFAVRNIKIHKISTMSEGRHLRMTLLKDGKYFDTVGFGMGDYFEYLKEGDMTDVAFGMDINDYKGFRNVQLILKDIRMAQNQE